MTKISLFLPLSFCVCVVCVCDAVLFVSKHLIRQTNERSSRRSKWFFFREKKIMKYECSFFNDVFICRFSSTLLYSSSFECDVCARNWKVQTFHLCEQMRFVEMFAYAWRERKEKEIKRELGAIDGSYY